MNTEHTQHPCETVDASADVMKLAEMILSDCGCSTAISDRLQRRVAGRIQLYVDNATQQLQGQVGALLAAMDVIALGELPDGKYANISTMMYAEEACKAAKRAPIKESLTADRQAEPVAWFYSDNFDKQDNLYRRTTVRDVAEGFARQGRRVIAQYDAAQPPAVAVAVPDGWDAESVRLAFSTLRYIIGLKPDGIKAPFDHVQDIIEKVASWSDMGPCHPVRKQYEAAAAHRAMLAATPQAATEGCGACGDGCQGQGCRLERESPSVVAQPVAHPCWSCGRLVTAERRSAADGDCPNCGAELDLEDWPAAAQKGGTA